MLLILGHAQVHISEAVFTAFLCFSGRNSSIVSDSTFYCKRRENPFPSNAILSLRIARSADIVAAIASSPSPSVFVFFFLNILLLLFLF